MTTDIQDNKFTSNEKLEVYEFQSIVVTEPNLISLKRLRPQDVI